MFNAKEAQECINVLKQGIYSNVIQKTLSWICGIELYNHFYHGKRISFSAELYSVLK